MQRSIYKYHGIMNTTILLFVLSSSVMETCLKSFPFCSKNHMRILQPYRIFLFVIRLHFLWIYFLSFQRSTVYLVSWAVFSVGWRSLLRIPGPLIFKGTGLKLSTVVSDYRLSILFLVVTARPSLELQKSWKKKLMWLVLALVTDSKLSLWQM